MKIIYILPFVLFSFTFGQVIEKGKIDTLDIRMLDDAEYKKEFLKGKSLVKNLLLEDGSIINYQDTITLGYPSGGASENRNAGGIIGSNQRSESVYSFVIGDRYAQGITPKYGLTNKFYGEKIVLQDIVVYKSGKTTQIISQFKKLDGGQIYSGKMGHILDLDKAYLMGEIILPNGIISKSQAIEKLKESKDLLDLEIITQEEYDRIKAELTPIIKEEK